MARSPRLTQNQRFAIARSRENGASVQQLARDYDVTSRTIYYAIRREQDRRRDGGTRTAYVSATVTDDELASFDAMLKRHGVRSRSDGLRRLIQIADDLFVPDPDMGDALHGVSASLNRIGNNVSQIAKRMNEANVKGVRPPFPDQSYEQMRSLAGFVFEMGDQVQQMVERRRAGLAVRVSATLKELADAQD